MKIYYFIFLFILLSCQNNLKQNNNYILEADSLMENSIKRSKKFMDSIYYCESGNFISRLEEIPNRDTNAYKISITSKKENYIITKILDTRPNMSHIDYCNDLYTVVRFPCGGPCYSQVFIFTDKNRPNEQYSSQKVKNNENIIVHIENEEFEKLVVHNFLNSKEIIVDISDCYFGNHGQMDSIFIQNDKLILYYVTVENKTKTKIIDLKTIL